MLIDGDFADIALTSIVQMYPQLRLAFIQDHRVSLKTATTLYDVWAGSPADRSHTFRQLCRGLVAFLRIAFLIT